MTVGSVRVPSPGVPASWAGDPFEPLRLLAQSLARTPGESGQLSYLLEQIAARREELEQRRRDIEVTLRELDAVERRCREALAGLPRP